MKKSTLLFVLLAFFIVKAQDNNDILLGVYIPEQAENIPSNATSLLYSRIARLITENGISGPEFNPRFVVAPKVAVLDKEVLGTAPPRIVLNLEMTLMVGDGLNGNLIHSETVNLKGVGSNEQKAYMNAIKRLAPKNPALLNLLEKAKTEIVAYYDKNCETIAKTAKSLRDQDKTFEALEIIANIPESTKCFEKKSYMIKDYYQKAINEQCKRNLNAAKAIWYGSQTLEGAEELRNLLSEIQPRAHCYDDVRAFHKEISNRIKELSDKEWDLTLKVVDAKIDAVNYSRKLLLEYVKGRPVKTIRYNIGGWY